MKEMMGGQRAVQPVQEYGRVTMTGELPSRVIWYFSKLINTADEFR